MKKIIASILSVAFLTTTFVSCNQAATVQKEEETALYQGTHIYQVQDTAQSLVSNGETDYRLVVPLAKTSEMEMAQSEFCYFFKEATGIDVTVVPDKDLQAESGKYISLGDTSLFAQSGITCDKAELKADGFQIVTKDDDVYLLGGSDKGVLYAVYGFMEVYFHYEQYFIDCFEIDRNVKNKAFKSMSVKDIPDIEHRIVGYVGISSLYTSKDYQERMVGHRLRFARTVTDAMIPIYKKFDDKTSGTGYYHNTDEYIHPDDYKDHEEWFSDKCEGKLNQLCYTAHGDEEEFNLMVAECAKKVINSLKIHTPKTDPQRNIVTITMEDNYNTCACKACLDLTTKYGTESGAVIIFVNAMNKMVREWMNQPENAEYKRDNLKIIFFAYNSLTKAPAKYNEKKGVYEPIDEKVALDEGVGVWLAPIEIDYQQSLYAEINRRERENIDAWSDLSNKDMFVWSYSTNFNHLMYQYDCADFYKDAYGYFAQAGATWIFNQGQTYQYGKATTGWHNLKVYLDSKLGWNSSLKMEDLMDDWFDAMFKEAAPTMKNLYYEMRSYQRGLAKENNFYILNSIFVDIEKEPAWWPLQTMLSWMEKADSAKKEIAAYQTTNPQLYQMLCDHIDAEWLSPAYATLKYHKDRLNPSTKTAVTERFIEYVERMGMSNYGHYKNQTLKSFIESL